MYSVLKRLAKKIINRQTLSYFLYYSGILHGLLWVGRFRNKKVQLILTGHRVLPDADDSSTEVSEIDAMALRSGQALSGTEFERRLRFLLRYFPAGHPESLKQGIPDTRALYLTLDDGYLDNITVATPILSRLHLKAIIFLIGDLLRTPDLVPWWDAWSQKKHSGNFDNGSIAKYSRMCNEMKVKSRGLRRDGSEAFERCTGKQERLYLSLEEVSKLHLEGTYYFGVHTMSHPNLTNLSEDELNEEINECVDLLRHNDGYLPIFAYPFGFTNEKVKRYLSDHTNIKIAFETGYGSDLDDYSVRRINLNTEPFPLFIARAAGIL